MKNFSIFKIKNYDGDPKKPSYSISAKIGDKYEYIGKCWLKENNGSKYFSCSFDKPYKDKAGWSITKDEKQEEPPMVDPVTGAEIDIPF